MGSSFAASTESSAHEAFKKTIIETNEGDTLVTLKELAPVRLIKNKFFNDVQNAYANCASIEDLKHLLGRARAKKGMFEGDLVEGELEIGQIAGLIHDIQPVAVLIENIMAEFELAKASIHNYNF
jgi:enoyl-[acyl-carrier protein] reductase II